MKRNKCLFLVYGTLKEGYYNNHHLGNAKFLGKFETKPEYTLFDGGYPVVERDGDTSIKGELFFSENPQNIASVFQLEGCSSQEKGHQSNWYDFDEIETPHGKAIMFVMNRGQSGRNKVLNNGEWK